MYTLHGHTERASPESQTTVTQATETSQRHTDRESRHPSGLDTQQCCYSAGQVGNKALEMQVRAKGKKEKSEGIHRSKSKRM